MPKLLEEREIKLEWTDMAEWRQKERVGSSARSSGVHLSGVIKHVLVTAGLLTPEDIADEMPLRMALGMAWEAWVVGLWPDMIWQPGEIHRDGVYGSPDGITGDCLEEFKCTWKSRLEKSEERGVRPPPKKIVEQRGWMMQIAGYLHMLGLTEARLHVMYVMGDYRGSGPQYVTYKLRFSPEELERMWNNMVLPNIGGATPESH